MPATPPTDRVRVGLIGAGNFGRHTAAIIAGLPELELVGVADVRADAAAQMGAEYGVPSWEGHEALLAACECEAVAIVTPHSTHRDISVASGEAGRHIFCEKTMAVTVAECHDMIESAEANGVKLMVGHKRRFRTAHAEIKRLLETGEFGRPMAINVAGYFGRVLGGFWTVRALCGGLMYWAGTHDVDTIRHYLGEVDQVSAITGPKLFPELSDQEDSIAVNLRFASGAIGSIQVSTHYPMATYRTAFTYQIVCERGGIAYDPRQVAVHTQLRDQPMQTTFFEGYGADEAYDREWSSFAAWILRDEPPVLTGEDGLRTVEIMQAAYISAEKQGAPVTLPLDRHERRPFG